MRTRILEANREAARFFHATLYSPAGREALDYYHRRGYTDSTIRRFGLGYAPKGSKLYETLRKKGFRDEELAEAFLCKKGQDETGRRYCYDIFRHRVMVPIIDIRGNVIAFGGRVLDDSKPKYVNTSDTLAFKKTQNLFALNFAKAHKEQQLILCEGYMDVIALHQAGFTNAVAALGTSFTADHARLVARYAKEAILIFDADAAGQKGTQRAIGLLRETGVDIRVVTIPDGKDPDEYIKKNGADRFRVLLDRSANDVEYRLIKAGQAFDLASADGKVGYLREAAQMLAGLPNPVERDVYAGRLASQLDVRKDAILLQIEQVAKQARRREEKKQLSNLVRQAETSVRQVNPEAADHRRAASAEEGLLGTLMLHPDYIRRTAELLSPEEMVTAFNRGVYNWLLSRDRMGLGVELMYLSEIYSEEEMSYIARMLREAQERANPPDEAERYAKIIKQEHRLVGIADPASMTPEQIQQAMKALRDSKK